MTPLPVLIDAHRCTRHPLFRWLKTHAEDAVSWDVVATHHHRALASTVLSLRFLRARLPAEARELLDHLMETTAPTRWLLPVTFTLMGEVCGDLEHLPEVERYQHFQVTSMQGTPLPTALGIMYAHCGTPDWQDGMALLITPFAERMDLIRVGLLSVLEIRAAMWDAVLYVLTGREVTNG